MSLCSDSIEIYLQNDPKNINKFWILRMLFKIEENIEIWTIRAISSYKMDKLVSFWAHFK